MEKFLFIDYRDGTNPTVLNINDEGTEVVYKDVVGLDFDPSNIPFTENDVRHHSTNHKAIVHTVMADGIVRAGIIYTKKIIVNKPTEDSTDDKTVVVEKSNTLRNIAIGFIGIVTIAGVVLTVLNNR